MKKLLISCLIASNLFACGGQYDKGYGLVECSKRCDDGCCAGDPDDKMTVCIRQAHDDYACGDHAMECQSCGQKVASSGNVIRTECQYAEEYDSHFCVLTQF